jgi:hypothetical protein
MTAITSVARRAANGAARPDDTLVVLVTHGPLATKRITPGPVIHGYDDAKTFAVREEPVSGIHTLAQALERLQDCPRAFVVRGAPAPGIDRRNTRRLAKQHFDAETGEVLEPTFVACPRRWLLIDFDDDVPVPTAFDWRDGELSGLHLIRSLPPQFAGRAFFWSFTSTAGIKPGLRMRLAFWLERPVSEAEAGRWLKGCPVDLSLYRAVQPHYTAGPVFAGMADPLPQRCGFSEDFTDAVPVPELPEPAPAPRPEPPPRRHQPDDGQERRYALAALVSEAGRLARTAPGQGVGHGRHAALFTGALRMSRFITTGALSCAEVTHDLITAAQQAGLSDGWDELLRTVSNALTKAAGNRP